MKLLDSEGMTIDAEVEDDGDFGEDGWEKWTIEARGGGGKNTVNPEYNKAFVRVLELARDKGAFLTSAYLDTVAGPAATLSREERTIPTDHNLPLLLTSVDDLDALRRDITRHAAKIARVGKTSGNPTRRISLEFELVPSQPSRSGTQVLPIIIDDGSGLMPGDPDVEFGGSELTAREGQLTERTIRHRKRESALREAKIAAALRESKDGRLRCEVPGCGFDFEAAYGTLGRGYAHVHHLTPIAELDGTTETRLEDLAIVCANCHAMIHRGGQCRAISELIQTGK